MVARCSNPACSASFRHLKEGRLFRLETDPTLRSSNVTPAEYFWLCGFCSSTMTLRLNEEGIVLAVELSRAPQSAYFIATNRQRGLLLSDVSFSIKRQHESAGFVG